MKKYDNFFEEIKMFQEKQTKQKQRGLNDYNLLTAVLEPHDEVRLHSRMIGSLLRPDGLHYQNTLFFEKFIDELKLDNFELDLENISVGIEYRDIDIYITDGVKHIIIENKIWANDQPCQIIKYINIIVEENKNSFFNPQENDINIISKNLLRVIYLTPQNKVLPNEHVVNEDDFISFNTDNITSSLEKCSADMKQSGTIDFDLKNYKVKYKKIDYQNILNWLQKCKHEVQNITNLNEAIRQYIDVVKMINKNYKGKVMTLDTYLTDENKKFDLNEINDFLNEIEEMQKKIRTDFIEEVVKKLDSLELKNENMLKGNKFIDITINDFIIRYGNFDSKTIILQIGDKENSFNKPVEENIKSKIFKELEQINSNFKGEARNFYGVLEMGEIKFQTQNQLLENIVKYSNEIKQVLEKF
ncbi:MAG: PD-(D/E)XK nuclease family protein [Candidatus Gracilibacteria bacterium]|nr:PD-(D/E)XK nuclease family protein [Candidatus Gracilibacteria bacterium]